MLLERETTHYIKFLFSLLVFLSTRCINIYLSENPPKPDLTIEGVSFIKLPYEREQNNPEMPSRPLMPRYVEYEFLITMANKGTSLWANDIVIGYSLSEKDYNENRLSEYQAIPIDKEFLPLEQIQITISIKLKTETKHILFIANPKQTMNKNQEQSPELFFQNNSMRITLKQL